MSQVSNVQDVTALQVAHEHYINEVAPHLAHSSETAALFEKANKSEYNFSGSKLVLFADMHFANGAMATGGYIPDHQEVDAVRLETTPARMYRRLAIDGLSEALGKGKGMAEAYLPRLREQMAESWKRMNTRHIHGDSNATIAKVASVTSTTVIVLKDGYGHAGTNPGLALDKNSIVAVLDASASFATLGASKITSYNPSTKTLTLTTAITGMAAEDVLVFATNTDTAAARFDTERGEAPNGLRNIIDPDENNSSFMGVAEADELRWKPLRVDSSDFGETELMEFIGQIEAHGETEVTADSHAFTCQRAVAHEYAKTLIGYTSIQQKGGQLAGGWTGVKFGEHTFVVDGYHTHDELMAHCLADYRVVDLGAPSVFSDDGSEWSRSVDHDSKELWMRWYAQRFCKRRNRSGVLKSITVADADKFASVPR